MSAYDVVYDGWTQTQIKKKQMDKIIVFIGGIVGIILTAWFFFGKKEEAVEAGAEIEVVVKGGYSPSVISIKKDKKTTINFLRSDESSCLEEVILPEFKIKKFLPLNTKVSIVIQPKKSGSFPFSCAMGMFHGKLIVKN